MYIFLYRQTDRQTHPSSLSNGRFLAPLDSIILVVGGYCSVCLVVVEYPSIIMSLRSHSHLTLPLSYKDWRLHHVLVVYVGSKVVQSLWSSTKKKDSIIHQTLEHLSHRILSFASSITDQLLPLLYHPIVSRFIPDTMIRWGIQLRLGDLLHNSLQATTCEEDLQRKQAIVQELSSMPIAIETQAANDQHYEVPAKFYDYCLVRHTTRREMTLCEDGRRVFGFFFDFGIQSLISHTFVLFLSEFVVRLSISRLISIRLYS